MASWNQVRSGFIADDETNNFGTRTFAEDNGSLYEVSTLATIQSVDQVLLFCIFRSNRQISLTVIQVTLSFAINKLKYNY